MIRSEANGGGATGGERASTAAEAFVLEVLRSDQAERLMRLVTRDIVFDGYLIPKGARVRVCVCACGRVCVCVHAADYTQSTCTRR